VIHAYKMVISQRAGVRVHVDGRYGTHTTCMSVTSVKPGDGKYYANESCHTREGVYLVPKAPNQSTMH